MTTRWLARSITVLIGTLTIAGGFTASFAGGDANFVLGGRRMGDEAFWHPLEDQGASGVTVDFGRNGWPVQLAAGINVSEAEDRVRFFDPSGLPTHSKYTGTVQELSFGVMKIWQQEGRRMRPYLGGGLSYVTAMFELEFGGSNLEDHDSSIGAYAQGGVFWRLRKRLNIGVDARMLRVTDIQVSNGKGDADYEQLGFLLGWGWD